MIWGGQGKGEELVYGKTKAGDEEDIYFKEECLLRYDSVCDVMTCDFMTITQKQKQV